MRRMKLSTRLAWLACLALGGCGDDDVPATGDAGMHDAAVEPAPEVVTSLGTVRGRRGDGFQAFLGVPYAEPPVGERRWIAPEPHPGWDGVLEARAQPEACPQDVPFPQGEEDCLFLNVHTPDPRPSGAPVMVWIHGGGFTFGEGMQIDGGTAGDVLAARHGLVVVSMNYRLGPLGFMGHPALGSSGNEGLLDQRLALAWVRDHVAAFGGDPAQVTIVGESAGGLSVCLHLVSLESHGLFARAISQSGLCDSRLPTRADADETAARVIAAVGCEGAADVRACMMGKTADELVEASGLGIDPVDALAATDRGLWPSIDGTVIPASFRDRVLSGDAADVPAVVGWNRDEGTLFVGVAEQAGAVIDDAVYRDVVALLAAEEGLEPAIVEAAYPLSGYDDPGAALSAALGHHRLACPSRRAAHLLAEAGRAVRVYRFDYPDAGFQLSLDRPLGAFHSAEIQFVFGHPAMLGAPRFTGDDVPLHEAISAYWARFVATADPNGDGAPAWPAYDVTADEHLVLDRTIGASSDADAEACSLWEPTP
jgi:para-nitrobenzyl esterase